jgi:acyl transferase domain-containing protein
MSNKEISNSLDGIAVIGMVGRFPGARHLSEFWHNLSNGIESIACFSNEELKSSGVESRVLADPRYVKAKGSLEDIELFDATFFDFTPREAEAMDPQHRFMLECAWEALENAGYNSEKYDGRIGVYMGAGLETYFLCNVSFNNNLMNLLGSSQIAVSNLAGSVPTSISYRLNLKGPSLNIQTACSTSLVTTHVASQSLLAGECDIALAGGVCINVPNKAGYLYQEDAILSPDGHCRAFDAKAQGTVGGNGIGLVVLKRLEDALRDRDYIHAVIKGSAINNDGSLKVGYTAPSVDGQSEVIAEAMALAGFDSESIHYVEAHGTGTHLGDPIEIAALTQAFNYTTQKKGFCAIGSVKTNIGHLDAAAGVAGLIKTVLSLKHKKIPPSLYFENPNPKIDFANSPFYVNNRLLEWTANGGPRRAGVSSFGIGGTNAHVVLEEAPECEPSGSSRPWQLLLLSGKTDSALESAAGNLHDYLKEQSAINLADTAYTLQVGRKAFDYRRVVVCRDTSEAIEALAGGNPIQALTGQCHGSPSVTFMFSGQGSQYVSMASELYQHEPVFRKTFDLCCEYLRPYLKCDLSDILYPDNDDVEQATEQLNQTSVAQPAIFAIEYSLAKLMMEYGIHPESMIGHSIGEYVAACISGVLCLKDALSVVATRGQMMQQLAPGSMLAVSLSESKIRPLLSPSLSLASINGPGLCVVSGLTESILDLEKRLSAKDIHCRRLHVSHAFHSEMMAPVLDSFMLYLKNIKLNKPQIPYISNITGTWITAEQAMDPSYWAKHLRHTVRFSEGIYKLLERPNHILVEIGPGNTLTSLASCHLSQPREYGVLSTLRHPQQDQSDESFLLTTFGKLWLCGVDIDWSRFSSHEARYRVPLPTYPFERQRYWIEPQRQATTIGSSSLLKDEKRDVPDWFYSPSWSRSLLTVDNSEPCCCVMFVGDCNLSSQLASSMKQEGFEVVTVSKGPAFNKLDDLSYSINPRQSSDYIRLCEAVYSCGKVPGKIIHLWNVTDSDYIQLDQKRLDAVRYCGFYSLVFLAQALIHQNMTDNLEILVISNDIHEVAGGEKLCPEKAMVLGPIKVIPQEHTNIVCRNIDVVIHPSVSGNVQTVAEQLFMEVKSESSDRIVAYRGNYRWTQHYEAIRLGEKVGANAKVREGGVYLITGGLGNVGLILARHLAQSVQAKLILMGRSVFPACQEWDDWLSTHDVEDAISCKIRKLLELEQLGSEVMVVSADVGDRQQLLEAISKAESCFGSINGVIHAAVTNGEQIACLVSDVNEAESRDQFWPKVEGLLLLADVFKDKGVDFCLLMSSLSSILGGLGFTVYSAANAFMDAFILRQNRSNGIPWISVNWDGWCLTENVPNDELLIMPEEGADAFERILYSPMSQVVVSVSDLQDRINKWIKLKFLQFKDNNEEKRLLPTHSRPNLSNAYVAPRNEIEQTIAEIWEELLGVDQVGVYDNFFELGGHSLLATQLTSRLRDIYNTQVSIRTVFENNTIAKLAEQVFAEQLEQMEGDALERLIAEVSGLTDGEAREQLLTDDE